MFAPAPASPWLGGSENRNLVPPRTDGALAPAKTRHPSPFAAVGSNTTIPVDRVVQTAHGVALGRRTPVTPTEHLKEGAVCFILGKRTSKKRTLKSDAEGMHVLTGLLASAHASRFSQLCSLPFLQAYFHETLVGETIALDTPLGPLIQSLPEAAVSTSDPLGQLVATHRRFLQPGVRELGGGDPGDLSTDRLTALPDYAQKVGFAGSEAAAAPERYQGLLTRDYGVFLRGKGGENALLSCTPGGFPLIVPSDDGTPTIQPHRVSRNLGDEAAAAALDALLVQHGLTDFRPDGLVKSKFANTPDDPVTDNALDVRDGALYNVAAQGPAAAASWTGDPSMAVLIVLICDCWHDEPTEPLLQPGAIDTTAKHDAYCALRKQALAEGFNAADFEAKQVRAFQGELKEAGRLCCFRVVATTSSQLVNYGKYRPTAATATSAETKSTQELTGASRCGLKMCNRFSELIVGGWEIGRVLDTSLSRAALPPGAPLQARSGVNTSLSKVDVNIAWRSSVALHRMYANSEGEVAARYEKTKTVADLKAINARLPSKAAFDARAAGENGLPMPAPPAAAPATQQSSGPRRQAPPPKPPQRTTPAAAANPNAALLPPVPAGGVPWPANPAGEWDRAQIEQLWNLLVAATRASGSPPAISKAKWMAALTKADNAPLRRLLNTPTPELKPTQNKPDSPERKAYNYLGYVYGQMNTYNPNDTPSVVDLTYPEFLAYYESTPGSRVDPEKVTTAAMAGEELSVTDALFH